MKEDYGKKPDGSDEFEFWPLVILRTPLFPHSDWVKDTQEMLDRREFRTALHVASPSLYGELFKKGFRLERLSKKEITSVEKYHNRICFRPTPFGIMAGFSVLEWNQAPLVVSSPKECIAHLLPDFGELEATAHAILTGRFPCYCYANPTLYKVGKEYRFIVGTKDAEQTKKMFRVDSIACADWLDSLLHLCRRPTVIHNLASALSRHIGQSLVYAQNVLIQLLEAQVLLPEGLPNITGRDYSLKLKMEGLTDTYHQPIGSCHVSELNERYGLKEMKAVYLNMERPTKKGGADEKIKEDIKNGLEAGALLVPNRDLPSLENFKKRFQEKFDQQTVPLMVALDPETGVGYEDLLQISTDSILTSGIQWDTPVFREQTIPWTQSVRLLMEKLCSGKKNIHLEDADIVALKEDKKEIGIKPPGISVLFRKCQDGKTYLENAGGITPLNLMGRFTPFHEKISNAARAMAMMEAENNPGVVFAEIVHFSNSHVANIERREAIRDYEIPILTGSGVDRDHRIAVNDLFVAVRNGEVILWSIHLHKRVIPRLDSAYNYGISDLPVFRFLCDLQGQGLFSTFTFSLKDFLPGLWHYPRLEYRNTVLCLEEWHIKRKEWAEMVQLPDAAAIRGWLEGKGLPLVFALTSGDRQIIIYSSRNKDVCFLSRVYKDKIPENIVIREFPFVGLPEDSGITDNSGNGYIGQYIAHLYNRNNIYRQIEETELGEIKAILPKRVNYPQDGWLYFKIYCHESRANEIIAQCFYPLSKELETSNSISKWYFIRYNEHGCHLRLRFQLKEDRLQEVMGKAHSVLAPWVSAGTVSKIEIAPYERELERYGKNIGKVESFFHMDSRWTAACLHYGGWTWGQPEYYAWGFQSINALTDKAGMGLKEKAAFHERCYEGFRAEQHQQREIYRELQPICRKFSNGLLLGDPFLGQNERIASYFIQFKNDLEKLDLDSEILGDFNFLSSLIHMQLNRLLICDFRRQEMVVHYILWKHYLSIWSRKKQNVNHQSTVADRQ